MKRLMFSSQITVFHLVERKEPRKEPKIKLIYGQKLESEFSVANEKNFQIIKCSNTRTSVDCSATTISNVLETADGCGERRSRRE